MADRADISPLDRWKWAVTVPVDQATDRAVLSCLAESADRRTLTTTRTLRSLAAQSGTNERGALKALARLEARGLVTIERRGRNRATRYVLRVDLTATVAVTDDEPLLPLWQRVAATVAVDPGLYQEEGQLLDDDCPENLEISHENAWREADGTWHVGPYRL